MDSWQQWQQGWGDHWGFGGSKMMGRGMGMGMGMGMSKGMGKGMGMGNGNNTPRSGSPFNSQYGNNMYMGDSMEKMGSYRPGSAGRHPHMGGMSGEHWKYNKPG